MQILKHLKTVSTHKYFVWVAMRQCGCGFRGLFHDMSKFGLIELLESIKYSNGEESPISLAKKDKGYSMAWFHHRGRNPHHSQYWCDISFGEIIPCKIPWKYLVELICDGIAAGKTYMKKDWNSSTPLEYFINVDSKSFYHEETREMLTQIYREIEYYGWDFASERIKKKEYDY